MYIGSAEMVTPRRGKNVQSAPMVTIIRGFKLRVQAKAILHKQVSDHVPQQFCSLLSGVITVPVHNLVAYIAKILKSLLSVKTEGY